MESALCPEDPFLAAGSVLDVRGSGRSIEANGSHEDMARSQ